MLTGSQLLVRIDGKRIEPEYLLPNAGWVLGHCQLLIDWWMASNRLPEKMSRRELREIAAPLLSGPGNPRIWEGFYHILQSRASFTESSEGIEEQLRLKTFELAALARKNDNFDRDKILIESANSLGMDPALAEARLFSDLPGEQILIGFEPISPDRLVHAYNIGLIQGLLLQALSLEVEAIEPSPVDLRRLIQRAKFHKLLASFEPKAGGRLKITVDGPLSIFGRATRYGFQLACFFPWILTLDHFELKAKLAWGKRKVAKTFHLDSGQGLKPVDSRPDPSCQAKEDFITLWKKNPDPSWNLEESHEVLREEKKYWVPDICLTDKNSGIKFYLEFASWSKGTDGSLQQSDLPSTINWLVCLEGSSKKLPPDPRIYGYRKVPIWEEIASRIKMILGV